MVCFQGLFSLNLALSGQLYSAKTDGCISYALRFLGSENFLLSGQGHHQHENLVPSSRPGAVGPAWRPPQSGPLTVVVHLFCCPSCVPLSFSLHDVFCFPFFKFFFFRNIFDTGTLYLFKVYNLMF